MKKLILPIIITLFSIVTLALGIHQFMKQDYILFAMSSIATFLLAVISFLLFKNSSTTSTKSTDYLNEAEEEISPQDLESSNEELLSTQHTDSIQVNDKINESTYSSTPVPIITKNDDLSIENNDESHVDNSNLIHESLSNIRTRLKPKKEQYLLFALIINLLYLVYAIYSLIVILPKENGDLITQLIQIASTNLLALHVLSILVASLTNYLAWQRNSKIMALVTMALYIFSLMLMPLNFWGVVVQLVLCYLGYSRLPE